MARRDDEEEEEPRARRRLRRRRRDDYDDDDYEEDDVVKTLIPYTNGLALGAYYCGVFGLIPGLGVLLGPMAFVLGVLGLRYARNNPKAKGGGHAITGIILGALSSLGHIAALLLVVFLRMGR